MGASAIGHIQQSNQRVMPDPPSQEERKYRKNPENADQLSHAQ
jgi:hypothetical protein